MTTRRPERRLEEAYAPALHQALQRLVHAVSDEVLSSEPSQAARVREVVWARQEAAALLVVLALGDLTRRPRWEEEV